MTDRRADDVAKSLDAITEALALVDERGRDAAVKMLVERLAIGEGQAREIIFIATHPDPKSLAGRV